MTLLLGSLPREGCGTLSDMTDSEEREEKLVKTGEVLERAGISRQVLYRYMQLDLIVPVRTTGSGRNEFSPKVFRILELIERMKDHGYTLRDIKDLVGKKMATQQQRLELLDQLDAESESDGQKE